MDNKKISIILKVAIVIMATCGTIFSILWYPFTASLSVKWISSNANFAFWFQIIFNILCSIPCFVILGLGWKIADELKNDSLFVNKNSKTMLKCTYILAIDLIIFLIGNLAFLILKWNIYFLSYLMIFLVGVVVCLIFYMLSEIIKKVSALKEDSEGLI